MNSIICEQKLYLVKKHFFDYFINNFFPLMPKHKETKKFKNIGNSQFFYMI